MIGGGGGTFFVLHSRFALQGCLISSRQLRKAVVDHVSDSFLEADGPLMLLVAAAQEGKEQEVEECAGEQEIVYSSYGNSSSGELYKSLWNYFFI